jgi:hypothetical protein
VSGVRGLSGVRGVRGRGSLATNEPLSHGTM